jgi:glycerol kinase
MSRYVLVLDVGTTTIKALIFDESYSVVSKAVALPSKIKKEGGIVEQSPMELLNLSKNVIKEAVFLSKLNPKEIVSIGITNQRETVIAWNSETGLPCYPAIVWEDTRTASYCKELDRHDEQIKEKTGLRMDPYFSASKMHWLFKHPSTSSAFLNNTLRIGTVDSWILWNLSNEKSFFTDYTNASRTLLFSIKELKWDHDLVHMFSIPMEVLAKTLPSASEFGTLIPEILGVKIPINAICGDQQASHYGAGDSLWTTKATFGTGIFVSQTIGEEFKTYPGFFTTLLPHAKQPWYGIEVAIPNAGARMQLVLENPERKLALVHEFAESVAKSVAKLPHEPHTLIIDGGITQAKELAPTLARLTGLHIKTQKITDGTALGVAKLLLGGENFPRTL